MNKKQWANGLISLMALMAFVYGLSRIAGAPDITSLFSPEVKIGSGPAALEARVSLDGFELNIKQVTKRLKAVFEIRSTAEIAISDIVIVCDFYDNNGGTWGRGRWNIYAALPGKPRRDICADRQALYLVSAET